MTKDVLLFLWGAISLGCGVAGLFFFKFWRATNERLFLYFAFAFWALTAHWAGLAIAQPAQDSRHLLYLLRLLAFVILIVGIIDKNRRAREG
jgi:hypothetical protein